MNPVIKNILGLVLGLVMGSIVNMLIIQIGPSLIPLPEGAVLPPEGASMEELTEITKRNMSFFTAKDYVMPFLAHALGALVGAVIVVLLCASQQKAFALVVGVFFLLGGITAASMFGWPMPFSAIDLVGAYIPFALAGYAIGFKLKPN